MASNSIMDYLKNVGQSVKFAAIESVSEKTPNLQKVFGENNKKYIQELYKDVNQHRQELNMIDRIRNATVFKQISVGWDNLKDSIKTGKFKDDSRSTGFDEMEMMFAMMGDDFLGGDSDLIEAEMNGEETGSTNEHRIRGIPEITKGDALVATASATATKNAASSITKAIVRSAELTDITTRKSTNLQLRALQQQANILTSGFQQLASSLHTINQFNSQVVLTHAQNSRIFFEQATSLAQERNAILKEMLEMQRETFGATMRSNLSSDAQDLSKISKIFDKEKGFDLRAYMNLMQKKMKETPIGMLMMSVKMLPMMIGEVVQNPMHYIAKMGIDSIIDNSLKKAISNIDASINGFIATGLAKLANYGKDKATKNTLLGQIARFFGVRNENTRLSAVDTSKYNKEAMQWNGIAQKALVEVIPGHLRRIEAALTGEGERVFDLQSGKWSTMKNVANIEKDIDRKIFKDTFSAEKNQLLNMMHFNSRDEMRGWINALDSFFKGVKNRGMMDYNHIRERSSEYGDNENLVKAIAYLIHSGGLDSSQIFNLTNKINEGNARKAAMIRDLSPANQSLINEATNNSYNAKWAAGTGSIYGENGKQKVDKNGRWLSMPFNDLTKLTDTRGYTLYDYQYNILQTLLNMQRRGGGIGGGGRPAGPVGPVGPSNGGVPVPNIQNTIAGGLVRTGNAFTNTVPAEAKDPNSAQRQHAHSLVEKAQAKSATRRATYHPDYSGLNEEEKINYSIDRIKNAKSEEELAEILVDLQYAGSVSKEYRANKKVASTGGVFGDLKSATRGLGVSSIDSFMADMQEATSIADKFNVVGEALRSMTSAPQKILTSVLTEADRFMYEFMFGNPAGTEKDENGQPIEGFFGKVTHEFGKTMDNLNNKFNDWFKDTFKKGAGGIAGFFKGVLEDYFNIDVDEKVEQAKRHAKKYANKVRKGALSAGADLFGIAKESVLGTAQDLGLYEPDEEEQKKDNKQTPPTASRGIKKYSSRYGIGVVGPGEKIISPGRGKVLDNTTGYKAYALQYGDSVIPSYLNPSNAGRGRVTTQSLASQDYNEKALANNIARGNVPVLGTFSGANASWKDIGGWIGELKRKEQERFEHGDGTPKLEDAKSKRGFFHNFRNWLTGYNEPEFTEEQIQIQEFIKDIVNSVTKAAIEANGGMFEDEESKGRSITQAGFEMAGKLRRGNVDLNTNEFQEALKEVLAMSENIKDPDFRDTLKFILNTAGYQGEFDTVDESKEVRRSRRNNLFVGVNQFMDAAFGIDSKKAIDTADKTIRKNLPELAKGGTFGALLSTVLPLGGPLMGALVGAGASILSNNKSFQSYMFGTEITDANGNVVDRKNDGIVSRKTVKAIQRYLPDAKKYGITGALAGLILPFGPLGGMMIGAGASFLKNNSRFQEFMFGEEGGLINKDRKERIKRALPNIGVATLGTLFLGPFGIMGNAMLGAGLGILSTTESFKRIMLGSKDRNGIRRGGLADIIRRQITDPFKKSMQDIQTRLAAWFKDDLFNPVARTIKPLGRNITGEISRLLRWGAGQIFGKKGEKEKSIFGKYGLKSVDRMLGLVRNAGGLGKFITGGIGNVIGAGAHALENQVGKRLERRAFRKGYYEDGTLADERMARGAELGLDVNNADQYALGGLDQLMAKLEQGPNAQKNLTSLSAALSAIQSRTEGTSDNLNRQIAAERDNIISNSEKLYSDYLKKNPTEKNPHDLYRKVESMRDKMLKMLKAENFNPEIAQGEFAKELAKSDLPREIKDQMMELFLDSGGSIAKFQSAKDNLSKRNYAEAEIAKLLGYNVDEQQYDKLDESVKKQIEAIMKHPEAVSAVNNDIRTLKERASSDETAAAKLKDQVTDPGDLSIINNMEKQVSQNDVIIATLEHIANILQTNDPKKREELQAQFKNTLDKYRGTGNSDKINNAIANARIASQRAKNQKDKDDAKVEQGKDINREIYDDSYFDPDKAINNPEIKAKFEKDHGKLLKNWEDQYQKGVITEEEYYRKRNELLKGTWDEYHGNTMMGAVKHDLKLVGGKIAKGANYLTEKREKALDHIDEKTTDFLNEAPDKIKENVVEPTAEAFGMVSKPIIAGFQMLGQAVIDIAKRISGEYGSIADKANPMSNIEKDFHGQDTHILRDAGLNQINDPQIQAIIKNAPNMDASGFKPITSSNAVDPVAMQIAKDQADKNIPPTATYGLPFFGTFAGGTAAAGAAKSGGGSLIGSVLKGALGGAKDYFTGGSSEKKEEPSNNIKEVQQSTPTAGEVKSTAGMVAQFDHSKANGGAPDINTKDNVEYTSDADGNPVAITKGPDGTPMKLHNKDNEELEKKHNLEFSFKERSANALEAIANKLGAGAKTAGKAANAASGGLLGGLLDSIGGLINTLFLGLPVGTFLLAQLRKLPGRIFKLFTGQYNIIEKLTKLPQTIAEKFTAFKTYIKELPGKLMEKVTKAYNGAKNLVSSVAKGFKNVGKSIIKGIMKHKKIAVIATGMTWLLNKFGFDTEDAEAAEKEDQDNENTSNEDTKKTTEDKKSDSGEIKTGTKNADTTEDKELDNSNAIHKEQNRRKNIDTKDPYNNINDKGVFGGDSVSAAVTTGFHLRDKYKEAKFITGSEKVTTNLKYMADEAKDKIKNVANNPKGAVKEGIALAQGKIRSFLQSIVSFVGKWFPGKAAGEAVNKFCKTIIERLSTPRVEQAMAKALARQASAAAAGAASVGIGSAVVSAGFVIGSFISAYNNASSMFNIPEASTTMGMKIIAGLVNAVHCALTMIPIVGLAIALFIESKDLLKIATKIIGPVVGLSEDNLRQLQQSGDKVVSNNVKAAEQAAKDNPDLNPGQGKGESSFFDDAKAVASGAWEGFKNVVSSGASWVGDKLSSAGSYVYNKITGKGKHSTYGRGGLFGTGFHSQLDPAIAGMGFNIAGDTEKQTVRDSACGPMAMANAIESFGTSVDDEDIINKTKVGKEKNGGTPDYVLNKYANNKGFSTRSIGTSARDMANSLRAGNPLVLMGQNDAGETDKDPYAENPHYVTATGLDKDGNVIIKDPESYQPVKTYKLRDIAQKTTIATELSKDKEPKFSEGASLKEIMAWKLRHAGRSKWGRERSNGNAELLWNHLKSKGLSNQTIAGILGNFAAESGWRSSAVQSSTGKPIDSDTMSIDNKTGYGLAQWTSIDRQRKLHQFQQARGVQDSDYKGQLDFMLSGQDGSVSALFKEMDGMGPEAAAEKFVEAYERPAKDENGVWLGLATRKQKARELFDKEGKGVSSSSSFSGGSSSSSGAAEIANEPQESGIFGAIAQLATKLGSIINIFGDGSSSSSSGSPGSISGGPVNYQNAAKKIVECALAYEKSKIQYGQVNPPSPPKDGGQCDCSGMAQNCYKAAGIEIPRTADIQCAFFKKHNATFTRDMKQLKAGDLVFTTKPGEGVDHVFVYIGDGKAVNLGGRNGKGSNGGDARLYNGWDQIEAGIKWHKGAPIFGSLEKLCAATGQANVSGQGYSGYGPKRSATNRLIIHHTAGNKGIDPSAAEIDKMYKGNGWSGIGYHFVIRKNGSIERGRAEDEQGAHAEGANKDSIGIHVGGNFELESPTDKQIASLVNLIKQLCKKYNIPIDRKHILGHREVGQTACPGNNLYNQLDSIVAKAAGSGKGKSRWGTGKPNVPDIFKENLNKFGKGKSKYGRSVFNDISNWWKTRQERNARRYAGTDDSVAARYGHNSENEGYVLPTVSTTDQMADQRDEEYSGDEKIRTMSAEELAEAEQSGSSIKSIAQKKSTGEDATNEEIQKAAQEGNLETGDQTVANAIEQQQQKSQTNLMDQFFGGVGSKLDAISEKLAPIKSALFSKLGSVISEKFGKFSNLIGDPLGMSKGFFGSSDNSNSSADGSHGGAGGTFNGDYTSVDASGSSGESVRKAMNTTITSPYGWRTHPTDGTRKFHNGIDLGVDIGTPVPTPVEGVIDDVGAEGGYGNYVVVKDKKGYYHIFAHLSQPLVQKGVSVKSGHIIAKSGDTGKGNGAHCHYGVYKPGYSGCASGDPSKSGSVNPMSYSVNGLTTAQSSNGQGKSIYGTGKFIKIHSKRTKGTDVWGMGKFKSTGLEDLDITRAAIYPDFPKDIKSPDNTFGVTDELIKQSKFGQGKYGRGFSLDSISSAISSIGSIFNKVSKVGNSISGLFHHPKGIFGNRQDQKSKSKTTTSTASKAKAQQESILSADDPEVKKIEEEYKKNIETFNGIPNAQKQMMIQMGLDPESKRQRALKALIEKKKSNSITKAQDDSKFKLGPEGSHGEGPNGKKYTNNDIAYILKNSDKFGGAKTIEDAIKILEKDKRYTETTKKEDTTSPDSGTTGNSTTTQNAKNENIQPTVTTPTQESSQKPSQAVSAQDKLDILIEAQNKTNELLSAILNMAAKAMSIKESDVKAAEKTAKANNKKINETSAMTKLNYFYNNSMRNSGVDTSFFNPDSGDFIDISKRMQKIASM